MQRDRAPQQRALADDIDPLGQPVHGGLGKVAGGEVPHADRAEQRRREERGRAPLFHPHGDHREADHHAGHPGHHADHKEHGAAKDGRGGRGVDSVALPVAEHRHHPRPRQQKAKRLQREEDGVKPLEIADSRGVQQLVQRLERPGGDHIDAARGKEGKGPLAHPVVEVPLEQHRRRRKKQHRDKIHQRHRNRKLLHTA